MPSACGAFLTLINELNFLAQQEFWKPSPVIAEKCEYVWTSFLALNEAEAFSFVEPFYCTSNCVRHDDIQNLIFYMQPPWRPIAGKFIAIAYNTMGLLVIQRNVYIQRTFFSSRDEAPNQIRG